MWESLREIYISWINLWFDNPWLYIIPIAICIALYTGRKKRKVK